MRGYYTVPEKGVWEQVIEKSRFIGIVYPVEGLAEVEAARREVRAEYPAAKHYVYAYRLAEGKTEKASDDGEPQGTGGRPLLEILQYREMWNTLVVVARYFGGILLGTGGLTRAYGGTAKELLTKTGVTLLTPHVAYRLKMPYSWYENVKYRLRGQAWRVKDEIFREDVELAVCVPQAEAGQFAAWLEEFAGGQVSSEEKGVVWERPPESYERKA
ncbi:Ribosomal protein S5 domain 2-type fold [Acididesulfobacillus acetoxydans]|uniref:Ribosomal protein S5 domain 2-type fold n=1 Tax=Acididesulfobacillus acetoxydans TaxID=1561005 RepID=A0A8S0WN58_9FIRM|nr:YigZ family protein [Acididesulfobacillus acetoxydans]CAA7601064.1 Ribosomal protein S5 domain 2-type fold [Acididesulfobacillus acetoxydans]CEJ06938.1 YigZ protein [Acididesulfobacillus acetoxydans]